MSDKLDPKRLAEITDNAAKYYTGKCQAETDVKDLLGHLEHLTQERDFALQSVGSKVVQSERLVIERDHLRSTAVEQAETIGKLRNEVAAFEKQRDRLYEQIGHWKNQYQLEVDRSDKTTNPLLIEALEYFVNDFSSLSQHYASVTTAEEKIAAVGELLEKLKKHETKAEN
jgi:hypothetical protein